MGRKTRQDFDGVKRLTYQVEARAQRAKRVALQDARLAAGLKCCSRCHQVKPLGDFMRQHVGFGGREAKCKDCKREEQRPFRKGKIRRRKDRAGGSSKYKNRPAGAPIDYWQQLLDLQGGRCAYCHCVLQDGRDERGRAQTHLEHMLPRWDNLKSVWNQWDNVVLACADCNEEKGQRTVVEWRPDLLA